MVRKEALQNTRKMLQEHHQSHLLAFWDQLTPPQRRSLLSQIRLLDFSQIDHWVATYVKNPVPAAVPTDFTPPPSYPSAALDPEQQARYTEATELGKGLISAGKVAALVVAGGQGTRLGFDGPKGNFPISPVRNKTLFRIFAETIAAVSKRYNATCCWYIMTSPLNHAETAQIFRSNNYYGLSEKDVFIFEQGTLPNFGFDGKILLADKATIACSPDGHGGCLKALCKSGALEDMKTRGIEFISYWQIDNPIANILDPLFIGFHALDRAEMSSKALIKADPEEKVGSFCLVDGRVTVIEYSDLPKNLAHKRTSDGSLVFQLGSIAIHIISCDFVDRLNAQGLSLPLHRAEKEIPHIDRHGMPVEPTEPNGIKLESFVFDALPLASKSIILQTIRSQEFAPTKNAAGADSVETTKQMMVARAADWLESAGVAVPKKSDGSPDCLVEMAPSFALEKDDVRAKLDQIPEIKPGDKLYLV